MTNRKGGWIQTYTGKAFWPMDPRPEEVDIEDIAHALSMQCRFGGHSRCFYSVAQHSLLASILAPEEHALSALLHDASEAYLVDLPRPIKQAPSLWAYADIERRVQAAIAEHFGLPAELPACVKRIDDVLLATEARDLMAPHPMPWVTLPAPSGNRIVEGYSPEKARAGFLGRFADLWAGKR